MNEVQLFGLDYDAEDDYCPDCGAEYCRCDACPDCDGHGWIDDEFDYEGDGTQPCPACGGQGSL